MLSGNLKRNLALASRSLKHGIRRVEVKLLNLLSHLRSHTIWGYKEAVFPLGNITFTARESTGLISDGSEKPSLVKIV